MKYLLLSVLALMSEAYGAEYKLGIITSDLDPDVTDFFVVTKEDGSIDALHLVTTTPSGQVSEDVSHAVEQVMSGGVVLHERDGREVIRLKVENFSASLGGVIKLDYLFNGLNGSRGNLKLKLLPEVGLFSLKTLSDAKVNRLFIKANRTLFGIIGIKEIRTSYSEFLELNGAEFPWGSLDY